MAQHVPRPTIPKPTIPLAPWDIPRVSEADMLAQKPADKSEEKPTGPVEKWYERSPVRLIADRTFAGSLNVTDLDYVARAVLQLWDEYRELRERMRIIEVDLAVRKAQDDCGPASVISTNRA